MAIGCSAILISWLMLAARWRRFTDDTQLVLHRDNWIWLLTTWILLKCIHEAAHAIACKRHGGRVREMGVILILFAPMAYVDVTSSWRISSKWRRMQVAAAGMYIELLVAAAAIYWWSVTDSPFWSHLAHNIIVTAGLATILFNANPLMRFDGYYLVSDLLEIPNLYSEGAQRLHDAGRWLFFGERAMRPRAQGARGLLITAYGAAAACWRIVVCASLLIAASALWQGAGVALAGIAIAMWLSSILQKTFAELQRRLTEQPAGLARAAGITLVCLAGVGIAWARIPAPGFVTAPGVVEFQDVEVVRSKADGFVQHVLALDGQTVAQGDPIIVLENRELDLRVKDLQLAILQTKLRQRQASDQQRPAASQIEQRNLQAQQEQLAELLLQQEQLHIRARQADV